MISTHFGEHFTLDGYDASTQALASEVVLRDLILDLVELLGMKILHGPVMCNAPSNGKKDPGGWTGFVVVQESHISIHTFPTRRFVSADIYSCKNGMDIELIRGLFAQRLQIQSDETHFLKRGTRYPLVDVASLKAR